MSSDSGRICLHNKFDFFYDWQIPVSEMYGNISVWKLLSYHLEGGREISDIRVL